MIPKNPKSRQWESSFCKLAELAGTVLLLLASCIAFHHRVHCLPAAIPAGQPLVIEPWAICVLHIAGHVILCLSILVAAVWAIAASYRGNCE